MTHPGTGNPVTTPAYPMVAKVATAGPRGRSGIELAVLYTIGMTTDTSMARMADQVTSNWKIDPGSSASNISPKLTAPATRMMRTFLTSEGA